MKKTLLLFTVFALLSISLMAAETPAPTPGILPPTAMAVEILENGEDTGYGVSVEDLNNEYQYILPMYAQEQDFDPIFDGIFLKFELANYKAQRTLLDYYAFKQKITVNQLDLEQQVNDVVMQVSADPTTKAQVEGQYGSMENFYEFVLMVYRKEMTREAAINRLAPVSNEELQNQFELYKDQLSGGSEEVKASHILVETEEEALSLLSQIQGGQISFADAAAQYSLDVSNKDDGGDLKWFTRGMMVPEFEEAAFSAPLNVVTGPVETDYGFHLILVTDKKEGMTFAEFQQTEDYESFVDQVKAQKIQQWIPQYMTDNKISFVYQGTMKDVSDFSQVYGMAMQSNDYAPVAEYVFEYQPKDYDGRILLEVSLESVINGFYTGRINLNEEQIVQLEQKRLDNLKELSLYEDATLAALSRYYNLNPTDRHQAIRFFGIFIDQALELAQEEQIYQLYGAQINDQLRQAYPGLEEIATDMAADKRDRVVAYLYMIRINNILDEKENNQEYADKILQLDPSNTDVLDLVD
ncbi:MAG TPA: peptidylprolyl isomerase [Thermotogota bacterium]|nr:peptidylprolyl isomerase [Thermotogota bacterium]